MLWPLLFAGSDFCFHKHMGDLTCASSHSKNRVEDPGEFSALCIMFVHLELSRKHYYPIPSRSNLDWGTSGLFHCQPAASIPCLFERGIGSRQVVCLRMRVFLWVCGFVHVILVVVWHFSGPGGLVFPLQTHINCTSHSTTNTFSAFQELSI